jgi:hypothetical protein
MNLWNGVIIIYIVLPHDKMFMRIVLYHVKKRAPRVPPAVFLKVPVPLVVAYKNTVSFLDKLNMLTHYIGVKQIDHLTVIVEIGHRWR